MLYLIGKITICLLLASLLGLAIGWFLKHFFNEKHHQEQLKRFDNERAQHQQHISDLETSWQEKYTSLKREKDEVSHLLDRSERENVTLLKTRQPTVEKLSTKNKNLTLKNNKLTQEIVKLHKENKQIQPLTEQLVQLKQQQATHQDDLSRLAQEKQVLEEAQQCLSKEKDEYEEALCEMGCLKEQLIALTKDRDQIQTKINQLNTELSTEQQCTTELRAKNQILQQAAKSDDLQKITGIGKANEQALKKQGITCYAQIAAFSVEDEKKYGDSLGVFSARIEKEEWVKQAKQLHKEKYGEEI